MAQPQPAPDSKPFPQNIEAERSVLGAVLMDPTPKAITTAAGMLTSADFFHSHHQKIYHAMLRMHDANLPIDLITLTEDMARHDELNLINEGATVGAAYLAQLTDGVPRISNVAHYAGIVRDKAALRNLIRAAAAIQKQALDASDDTQAILARAETAMQTLARNGNGHKRPQPIALEDFLTMTLRPAEFVIDPILPEQGLVLLYCWRGGGKTYVCLEMAVAVATGGPKCFMWKVPRARRVLYVDGEMPANEMQERLQKVVLGRALKMPPSKDYLQIFTPDLVQGHTLNIVSAEGQRVIEDQLREGDFLILDNLSALGHTEGSTESEAESWWPVQEWALRLRKKQITVLFVHHAGKGGGQRGTSAREDLMHTVIAMKKPSDYHQHEGLRTEVHFEKLRRYTGAEGIYPFELKMETDHRGAVVWMQRPLKDITQQRIIELLKAGMPPRDVADEVGVSRSTAYRVKKDLDSGKI